MQIIIEEKLENKNFMNGSVSNFYPLYIQDLKKLCTEENSNYEFEKIEINSEKIYIIIKQKK